jgi:hypothetical protein
VTRGDRDRDGRSRNETTDGGPPVSSPFYADGNHQFTIVETESGPHRSPL